MKPMMLALLAALPLTPLLPAAAAEGQTPQEQYLMLIQSPYTTAEDVAQAFLALDGASQAQPANLVSLIEILMKTEDIDRNLVEKLSSSRMFWATSPIGKWLRNQKDERLKADLNIFLNKLKELRAMQPQQYIISFNDSDVYEPMNIPLATARKYSGLINRLSGEEEYPNITKLPISGYFSPYAVKIVFDLMKARNNREDPADLYNALSSKLSPIDTQELLDAIRCADYLEADPIIISTLGIYLKELMENGQDFTEFLNNEIAADTRDHLSPDWSARNAYIQLRKNKGLSNEAAFRSLSEAQRRAFRGISIQDLINLNAVPKIETLTRRRDGTPFYILRLYDWAINDLRGLKNIPGIKNVQTLNLSSNAISTIKPGDFAGLDSLEHLILANNRISSIEPNTFADLVRLRELNLGRNLLTSVPVGMLNGLENLENIFFDDNMISEVDPSVFAGLGHLKTISLVGHWNLFANKEKIEADLKQVVPEAEIIFYY